MLCLAESPQPTKPGSTQPSEGSHRQEGLHLVIKNWKGRVNCKDKGKMDSPSPWYSHSAEKLTNPLITGGWRALKLEASRVHKDGEWGLWEKHWSNGCCGFKKAVQLHPPSLSCPQESSLHSVFWQKTHHLSGFLLVKHAEQEPPPCQCHRKKLWASSQEWTCCFWPWPHLVSWNPR